MSADKTQTDMLKAIRAQTGAVVQMNAHMRSIAESLKTLVEHKIEMDKKMINLEETAEEIFTAIDFDEKLPEVRQPRGTELIGVTLDEFGESSDRFKEFYRQMKEAEESTAFSLTPHFQGKVQGEIWVSRNADGTVEFKNHR